MQKHRDRNQTTVSLKSWFPLHHVQYQRFIIHPVCNCPDVWSKGFNSHRKIPHAPLSQVFTHLLWQITTIQNKRRTISQLRYACLAIYITANHTLFSSTHRKNILILCFQSGVTVEEWRTQFPSVRVQFYWPRCETQK